jgi:membrane protein
LISNLFPESVRPTVGHLVVVLYYPVLSTLLVLGLATLYKIVLPNKLPWHRGLPGALLAMAVFLVSSTVLRRYISWVTSTGYTYGALATPIAFLLFSFFIAMAILLGAEFNNAIEEMWPAHPTRRERRRWRRLEMARYAARIQQERDRAHWQRNRGPDPETGRDHAPTVETPTAETRAPRTDAAAPADTATKSLNPGW